MTHPCAEVTSICDWSGLGEFPSLRHVLDLALDRKRNDVFAKTSRCLDTATGGGSPLRPKLPRVHRAVAWYTAFLRRGSFQGSNVWKEQGEAIVTT